MAEVFVFGDSIGYGATDAMGGWPDRLKQTLHQQKLSGKDLCEVYNLSVDGDTSEDVSGRIDNELAVRRKPWSTGDDIVVIAIGANDAGAEGSEDNYRITPERYRENLARIVTSIQKFNLRIVMVGLTIGDDTRTMPCQWGDYDYYTSNERRKLFDRAGKDFCKDNNIPRVELFEDSNCSTYIDSLYDGLHPSTQGHEWLYGKISPTILEMLNQ
jgi:lysophospholipase L1-like esterase